MRQPSSRARRAGVSVLLVLGPLVGQLSHATVASAATRPASHVHVMPRAGSRLARASGVASQSMPHLNYYGGHVIEHVKVVEIVWGAGTFAPQVTNDTAPNVPSFFGGVTSSTYMDWLSEYDANSQVVRRGTFAGRYTITPSDANNGSTIDDVENIQPELTAQINASNVPPPDPDTLYFIFFPAGKMITADGGNNITDFCAYHGTETFDVSTNIRYAVMPDTAASAGCGPTPGLANITTVASHELIEAITDPDVGLATDVGPPLGWFDPLFAEIGDICRSQSDEAVILGGDGHHYYVQKEWSNRSNACLATRTIAVGDASILEGDTSARTLRIPVTLSAPSASNVTVQYRLQGATATGALQPGPSIDFGNNGGLAGTLHFDVVNGHTPVFQWIRVPVYGDVRAEPTESFNVTLSNPSNGYEITDGTGRGTILTDDVAGRPWIPLGVGDMMVYEGAIGNRQLAFPVTIARPLSRSVVVHWSVHNVGSGNVVIAAGTTEAVVVLTVLPSATASGVASINVQISALPAPFNLPPGVGLMHAVGYGTIRA